MNMKIAYISGKISNLPYEEAFANFEKAESYLVELGHVPVNPMKHVPFCEGKDWLYYMQEDIKLLMNCDTIYMLNNWRDSKGATIEHNLAVELGMEIIYQKV